LLLPETETQGISGGNAYSAHYRSINHSMEMFDLKLLTVPKYQVANQNIVLSFKQRLKPKTPQKQKYKSKIMVL
jgi:hypothetical protein